MKALPHKTFRREKNSHRYQTPVLSEEEPFTTNNNIQTLFTIHLKPASFLQDTLLPSGINHMPAL